MKFQNFLIPMIFLSSVSFAVTERETKRARTGDFESVVQTEEVSKGASTALTELCDDAIQSIEDHLNSRALALLHESCKRLRALPSQKLAQAEIEALIGPEIRVDAGSYIIEQDRPQHFSYRYVQIDGFWMQQRPVSQVQYERIMGRDHESIINFRRWGGCQIIIGSIPKTIIHLHTWIGPNKPLLPDSAEDVDRYIDALNMRIAKLWPIGYPGEKVPTFRLPRKDERAFARTIPLPEIQIVDFKGEDVEINAIEESDPIQVPAIGQNLIQRHGYESYGVNVTELETNSRGFQGLERGIWEMTTEQPHAPFSSRFVVQRGRRDYVCHVSFWKRETGLRLVRDES